MRLTRLCAPSAPIKFCVRITNYSISGAWWIIETLEQGQYGQES